ncbi:MAG: hypothetical protein RLZZ156_2692 [Deinococcota bacterium]
MPQPPETTRDYQVQISQEYHAFLVCNTQITDSGHGKQVKLEIQKHKHRAVISFEALRSTANLNGYWRATLHIRCQADATLDHTMSLRRLRTITAENQNQPAFWSCTGDIGHFDSEQGILEIQIYPGKHRTTRFSIYTRVTFEQMQALQGAKFIHASGTLNGQQLIATIIEPRISIQGMSLSNTKKMTHLEDEPLVVDEPKYARSDFNFQPSFQNFAPSVVVTEDSNSSNSEVGSSASEPSTFSDSSGDYDP